MPDRPITKRMLELAGQGKTVTPYANHSIEGEAHSFASDIDCCNHCGAYLRGLPGLVYRVSPPVTPEEETPFFCSIDCAEYGIEDFLGRLR